MKRKQKIISIMLVFAMLFMQYAVALPTADAASDFAGGNGTADDPYVIMTLEQLDLVRNNLNAHYVLGADIDASDTATWDGGKGFAPIGAHSSNNFKGTFDGQGHTINGLVINRPDTDYIGLFGYVSGVVKNVGLVGGSITGREHVGGLVGANNGTVETAFVTGDVSGNKYVGGLVGTNYETIENAYVTGNVSGSIHIGGLVGRNYDRVNTSYATGNVNGSTNVGGLIGAVLGSGSVHNAYATGNVSGNRYVGGLVGANGTIEYAYATGNVSGNDYVGGLIGEGGAAVSSFWDIETTGQSDSAGGIGLTTDKMKQQTTFTGASWDFSSVWQIHEHVSDGYPHLRLQHTVRYDGNGNTSGSAPASMTYFPGDSVEVSNDESLQKNGYSFVNWNTERDGTGTEYEPEQQFTMGTTDVILYAQWVDDIAPSLTFEMTTADGSEYTSGTWTNQTVTAHVYASDGGSGMAALEYSLDGGVTWEDYPGYRHLNDR